MTRWQVYLVLGLGIFGLGLGTGFGISYHHQNHKSQVFINQANQAEGAAKAHEAAAQQSDRQAVQDQATVTTADAQAAAAKRELDRRLKALPTQHPASLASLPSIPDDRLAATQAALAQAQAVIAAQGDQLAARDRLIASLTASRDARKAESEAAEQSARSLRAAIQPHRPWAAGASWNPSDQTYGAWVEHDSGILRVGADAIQQRVPEVAGGGIRLQILVRLGFRWGTK